jgi:cell division transport system permease protein
VTPVDERTPPPHAVAHEAVEQDREELPVALRRDRPLVPVDSAGGRALVAVMAILTFLAALCAGAAQLVAANSAEWRATVAREATIQVRPLPNRDIEADVGRATQLARRTAGVREAEPFTKTEAERLLEPWLGSGLNLEDLPVPRLVVLRLDDGGRADLAALRRGLQAEVPGATVDDHGLWMTRLSTMARTVTLVGVALVVLVLAAAGLAVAFATRGAMAGNREIVEVLHYVGADDRFIAREFQRRFFQMGLKGGAIGGGAALAVIAAFGVLAASLRASPAGDQLEALFGAFDVGWGGYAAVVLIALAVSALAGGISGVTVRRFLNRHG